MRTRNTLFLVACTVLAFSGGVILALQVAKHETTTIRRFKIHTLTETETKELRIPVPVTTTIYSTQTVVETQTETVTETILDEGSVSGILDAILPKENHGKKERRWKRKD